jgi:hypothetical protein
MTSAGTWKAAERDIAKFHNPVDGRRTPLSGINSGHTHADCMGVEGLFIEVKYRKSFALWKLYMATKKLAIKEGRVPVVSIREKGKPGFIELVHSDYLDTYVQMYVRNRGIDICADGSEAHIGETKLTRFFSGTPMQVKFLARHLNHFSFDKNGILREKWDDQPKGEPLAIKMELSEGFATSLYGAFAHPMTVEPQILASDVTAAITAHAVGNL